MPSNQTSRFTIQEIPADTKPEDLVSLLNDRFRNLQESLKQSVVQDSPIDVDLGQQRIVSLADPRNDFDAVNLRTLRRQASNRRIDQQDTKPADSGAAAEQHYGMVFTKDGFVTDDEESPWYPIADKRQGSPLSAVIVCGVAPSTESLKVNWKIRKPDEIEPRDLLELPLEIEVGKTGPVFSEEGLKITEELPKGTIAKMVIVQAGDAEKVTGVVVIRRSK